MIAASAGLGRWLFVALLLHLSFAGPWWRGHLLGLPRRAVPVDPLLEIPLEVAPERPASPDPAPPAREAPPPPQPSKRDEVAVPEPSTQPQPAAARAPTPPIPPPANPPQATEPSPLGALADRRIIDPRANVRLLIHNQRLRGHPFGVRIGRLLRESDRLRDFFAAGIDPLHDVERLLLASSGLSDARGSIAVLQYDVPRFRVRSAVAKLAPHAQLDTGGEAQAEPAVRADTAYVLAAPQILVIAPEAARPNAERLPRSFRLPEATGEEVIEIHVTRPSRALSRLPLVFPRSLRWLRLQLVLASDGGAALSVRAQDSSPEEASKNAQKLSHLFSEPPFVQKLSLASDAELITGQSELDNEQLGAALDALEGLVQKATGGVQ